MVWSSLDTLGTGTAVSNLQRFPQSTKKKGAKLKEGSPISAKRDGEDAYRERNSEIPASFRFAMQTPAAGACGPDLNSKDRCGVACRWHPRAGGRARVAFRRVVPSPTEPPCIVAKWRLADTLIRCYVRCGR